MSSLSSTAHQSNGFFRAVIAKLRERREKRRQKQLEYMELERRYAHELRHCREIPYEYYKAYGHPMMWFWG